MASFNFGNDSTELDLSVGGDQGAAPKRPAAKPATAPPEATDQDQRPAQRPARPPASRTANLLHGQPARPAAPAARPAQPPRRQAPTQPTTPVQQPAPVRAPELPHVDTGEHTFPASQIPEPVLAQQLEEVVQQPVHTEPAPVQAPQAPVYRQPAQTYAPPAPEPVYTPQPPQPVYEQPHETRQADTRDDGYGEPQQAWQQREPRRITNEEPAFMSRQTTRDDEEPRNRQPEVVAPQEPVKMSPLMAFFAPFMGKGSNQTGTAKTTKKNTSAKRGVKTSKNDFAGGRQRVLIIRIVAFSIGGIVLLSGARALLFPYQGPTRAAVERVAQESVGYTGFPDATGQGVALAFTNLLLTFSNEADTSRDTQLLRYTTKDVLNTIGLTYNRTGLADNAVLQPQTIVQGPYIVAQKNLDATHALITTTAQVSTGQWLTISIPMLYTASNGSVTVYGSPTFMPQVTAAKVDPEQYTPQWSDDSDVDAVFRPDLVNYLTAWAADNDQSLINRYLTNSATATAKQGLNGAVKFNGLTDGPTVEAIDPKSGQDVNTRRAQFTVAWENPQNHIVYNQTYRAKLKFQQQRWFIEDITNISLVNGQ